ncbi:MAG: class I SAM-dependent methyltransferase [Ktedonobacteraceae bacterium]|nr:class I SAM-dependent methyltransferase [Ktedonobacteraceae bacterium]
MSTSADESGEQENTYFIDPESGSEMARLIEQDQVVTRGMGGLFSERKDMRGIKRILDLACGPGGWALNVATAYPDIQVVGIDISKLMIEYARAQAHVRRLHNIRFEIKDILHPLDFPDESFDLINARFIVFIPRVYWPILLQECRRLLRPGGTIRLTDAEVPITTSAAFQQFTARATQAFKDAGHSFSPDGALTGIIPVLGRLLRDAGYKRVQTKADAIEWSYGTESYQAFYHDHMVGMKLSQPFLIRHNAATQEEFNHLYDQALREMQAEDFCAVLVLMRAWGEKPT